MPPRRSFQFPWRSRARIRVDLDHEIDFHIAMRAEELTASGLTADEAGRQAHREFGDLEFTRQYCESLDRRGDRSDRRATWLAELGQDLRLTMRGARREPAYALIAIITLALGLGANAAVFSVLNAVLLRPSAFPEPERLVAIDENNGRSGNPRSDISAADFVDWRRMQRTFDGLAAQGYSSLTFDRGGVPIQINGRRVSANIFDVLGARPALGRTFHEGEDIGSNRLLVLTDGLWRQLFGADSTVVGRPLRIGDDVYTVIGVLRPDFVFPGATPAYFRPLDFTAALADVNRARKFHFLHAFGRVRRGTSIAEARADLVGVARQLDREYPDVNARHSVTVLPLRDALVGDVRPAIVALMGAAGFVLLIACANVANLALSRAVSKRRELAVRMALGAGRGRLVRQMIVESTALALIGGMAGLVVARAGTPALLALHPGALPPTYVVALDRSALWFALGVALATGFVVGLVPALATVRGDVVAGLGGSSRGASTGRAGMRTRSGLVVVQIALSMVLLVGAGLLVRTLAGLSSVNLGFDPHDVAAFDLPLSGKNYATREQISDFWNRLLDRLHQEPGLTSVAVTSSLPLAGGSGAGLAIDGRPVVGPLPEVRYGNVSDDFFATLRVPIRAGRGLSPDDGPESRGVVINEAAARKFWPGQSPIGARVRLGPDPSEPWSPVVGVFADYHEDGVEVEPLPLALSSYRYDRWNRMLVTVRSPLSMTAVQRVVAQAVRELDPALPVSAPFALIDLVRESQSRRRFALSLFGAFAAIALALALVGVYGVMSYGVAARTKEFGVRVALGAPSSRLLADVVGQGARLAAIGLAAGAVCAIVTTRLLAGLLFGVKPLDGATYVTVAALLAAATVSACWAPARRAANGNPVDALRND